ncbi:hypothetical protein LY78DRAFT_214441 [Colletotrichum sublineola]|nr:hypothetical protein LY78DRAFT_214441 [Colletotrichum sublineola]
MSMSGHACVPAYRAWPASIANHAAATPVFLTWIPVHTQNILPLLGDRRCSFPISRNEVAPFYQATDQSFMVYQAVVRTEQHQAPPFTFDLSLHWAVVPEPISLTQRLPNALQEHECSWADIKWSDRPAGALGGRRGGESARAEHSNHPVKPKA